MFEDIEIFCAIARLKSFTKAARELNLSTPVVTRRLARLEKSLNIRLLTRSTRQVLLTEAGSIFYLEVKEILQSLEASKESIKSLNQTISGTLKVGLPVTLSQFYVTKYLNSFLHQFPNIKIHIVSGNFLFNLLNEGFDLIVHCGEIPNSSFHYKKVGTMKKIICASPDYLERYGTPKTLADLTKHNCLGLDESFHPTWKCWDKNKFVDVLVKGNVACSSGIDLINLAIEGVGIAQLPYYLIHDHIQKRKLIPLLENNFSADHTLYAVYPTDKYLNRKTKLFREFLTSLLTDVCSFEDCEINPLSTMNTVPSNTSPASN